MLKDDKNNSVMQFYYSELNQKTTAKKVSFYFNLLICRSESTNDFSVSTSSKGRVDNRRFYNFNFTFLFIEFTETSCSTKTTKKQGISYTIDYCELMILKLILSHQRNMTKTPVEQIHEEKDKDLYTKHICIRYLLRPVLL